MKFIIREVFLWLLGEGQWEDAALTADAYAETFASEGSSGHPHRMTATVFDTRDTGGDNDYNDLVSKYLKESMGEEKEPRLNRGAGPDYSGRAFLEQFIALGKQYNVLKSYTRQRQYTHSTTEHDRLTYGDQQRLLLEAKENGINSNAAENEEESNGQLKVHEAQIDRASTSLYRNVILESLDKAILRKYEKHVLDLEAEVLEQDSVTLSYAWSQVEPYKEQFATIQSFLEKLDDHCFSGGKILDGLQAQMEKVTMAQKECLQTYESNQLSSRRSVAHKNLHVYLPVLLQNCMSVEENNHSANIIMGHIW